MLQSVLQERVRGNKALSLTGAIGVVEGLLFVVHLWVRCYQLPFFPLLGSSQTGVRAPGATQASPFIRQKAYKSAKWLNPGKGDASVPTLLRTAPAPTRIGSLLK